MSSWTRVNAPGLPEFPAFAHAAVVGDTIHLAGMIGLNEDFSAPVEGGAGPETTRALRLAEQILQECGASLADVVKVGAYLIDLDDYEAVNEAYIGVFGPRTPARFAVGCASLLFGARVELECTASRASAR